MTTERSAELFEIVDQFNAVHDGWVAEGESSPEPTLAYWAALDRMVLAFDEGDMPANCRELAVAVYSLAQEKAVFDLSGKAKVHDEFWYRRDQLVKVSEKLRSPSESRMLEPIAELHKQGVGPEQIARIWGLRRPDGSGNSALVFQELAKPGSVIGPNYVHPDDRKREKEAALARDKYLALSLQLRNQQADTAEQAVRKPCPETSFELWAQKVSLTQAAKMLLQDESKVSREWAQFEADSKAGIAKPPELPPVQPLTEPVITGEVSYPLPEEAVASDEPEKAPDPYAEFSEWSDKDVKARLKELGLKPRKNAKRETMIDMILEAEAHGIEIDAEGEPVAQE